MNNTTLLRKSKDTTDYVSDITKAFTTLSKRKKLYHITLQGIPTKKIEDLSFLLTNKFFNRINKEHRNPYGHVNYLFIMEYGGTISKAKVYDSKINDLDIHAHCLVDTSLTIEQLKFYINTAFVVIPDYNIQDISKSTTKDGLLNYLLKQDESGLMTKESYNYKILI